MPTVLVEEGEDVGEAVSGDRALVGDVAVVLALEPAQEVVLDLVARREVGVAALGRDGHVPRPVPEEQRLTEAGAGGDDGAVAGARDAGVQGLQLVRRQHERAVGRRLEVVQEPDVRRAEPRARATRRGCARAGWSVTTASSTTGPAMPKAAAAICGGAVAEEARDHLLEPAVVAAREGRRRRTGVSARAARARPHRARAASWCRRCHLRERCSSSPPDHSVWKMPLRSSRS